MVKVKHPAGASHPAAVKNIVANQKMGQTPSQAKAEQAEKKAIEAEARAAANAK